MYSRTALSAKYKAYLKALQALKSNLSEKKTLLANDNYEKLLKSLSIPTKCMATLRVTKDQLLNGNYVGKCKESLYTIQPNLLEKYYSKNKERKIQIKVTSSNNSHSKAWRNRITVGVVGLHMVESPAKSVSEPEPPPIPDATSDTVSQLNALREPTFTSLGLGGWTPVGLIQSLHTIKTNLLEKYYSKNKERIIQIKVALGNNSHSKAWLNRITLSAVGLHMVESPAKSVSEAIPEPPPIPDATSDIVSHLNALGEPTFASLGLGGWTPVGLVQHCFEYLHITLGIPWWEAIAIGTLIIRFFMFPLVVVAQRNAAKMNNYLPQMQVIQLKMTEARQSGNQLEVARYSQELMLFMKEKNLNPFKNMVVPLAQAPVFISFFMGLREMANVPVESLRTGGLFWFTDLTVPDQFFALPIITSLTLWATIELGTDSAKLSAQNLQTMKYVLRALPVLILPFTVNFPGAILCYWLSSNFISLAQVGFLKIPAVRDYFKIEPLLKHDPSNLPIKSKGFVGGIKDSWTNIKITKNLEERRRLDDLQFQRAGKGPMVKTYKYDPTKQVTSNPHAISAKKR